MKRPRKWLMVDAGAAFSSIGHDHEALGQALLIVLWEACGHEVSTEEALARVCGLSRTKWKKRGAAILIVRDALKRASQPRAMYRRAGLSAAYRQEIIERDGAVCNYCGATEGPFHIDHILPVSRGGTDDPDNLCVACAPCNFAKSASVGSEWNW